MAKIIDIKAELKNLDNKFKKSEFQYKKDRAKIIKKCNHNWKENGYSEENKYSGTQWYVCTICGEEKGEGY